MFPCVTLLTPPFCLLTDRTTTLKQGAYEVHSADLTILGGMGYANGKFENKKISSAELFSSDLEIHLRQKLGSSSKIHARFEFSILSAVKSNRSLFETTLRHDFSKYFGFDIFIALRDSDNRAGISIYHFLE